MIKAVFIDFYGTLVHEDGEIIKNITKRIAAGRNISPAEIGLYWWNVFEKLFTSSFGENFKTQRFLEKLSLEKTLDYFNSEESAEALSSMMYEHWGKSPLFPESREFLSRCPHPVYIVSNIDARDLKAATAFHGLHVTGAVTSEDAHAYKPRSELFRCALEAADVEPFEAIHIGDSLTGDIIGAQTSGIEAVWLNRGKKKTPENVKYSVENLTDFFNLNITGEVFK